MKYEQMTNGMGRSVERTGNGEFIWRIPYTTVAEYVLLNIVLDYNDMWSVWH